MENEKIVLKPKKKGLLDKIKDIFEDKKKRYIFLILFILPFIIASCVFGFVAYKGVKEIIELANSEVVTTDDHKIVKMNYALRADATDVQYAYFTELKNAIEVNDAEDDEIAGLVCKNFVADFYTWTNKQGQYDISALYYVYTPDKEVTYIKARDGFYKYINKYIEQYGKENLLEVESVEVTKANRLDYEYVPVNGDPLYDLFEVTCKWTYKANDIFSPSKYATSMNFLVVKRQGRMEIVEASENPIDARPIQEETTEAESEE